MKVCPSCGKECQDNDAFCAKCGTKLETEIKCSNCGKVLVADDNFCPACGTKVENTTVDVKVEEPKKADPETSVKLQEIARKILFFAFGGALLFLLVLMFVGCFGDIYHTEIVSNTSSYGSSSGSSYRISYFFGDAIKRINAEFENNNDSSFMMFSILALVFEYVAWLSAIAAVVTGIVLGIIALVKGKKRNYELNTKMYLLSLLGTIPYLFIFAIKNYKDINSTAMYERYISSTGTISEFTEVYHATTTYGWGTMMILICTVFGVLFLAGYGILKTIFVEKRCPKHIVKVSVVGGLALVLFISLVASTGPSVLYFRNTENASFSYFINCYTLFYEPLRSIAYEGGDEIPGYSFAALAATIIIFVGAMFALATIYKMLSDKKNKNFVLAYGIASAATTLIGYIVGLVAYLQAARNTSDYTFLPSPGAFVIITFLVLSMVGYCVTDKLVAKEPEQITQQ